MNKKSVGLYLFLFAFNVFALLWIRSEVVAGEHLRIQAVLPTEDLAETSRLTVVFDRGVVPAEALGTALDALPFRLEPPAEGEWAWSGVDRLTLELSRRLERGHVYRLSAEPDLEVLLGRRLVGRREFELSTSPLTVEAMRVAGAVGGDVDVLVHFDRHVDPRDLSEHLTVRTGGPDGGEVLSAEVLSTRPARELDVRVAPPPGTERLHVTLTEGLPGHRGELGLASRCERELALPRGFALLGARVRQANFDPVARVELSFSDALDLAQGEVEVAVEPAVPDLETTLESRRLVLSGRFEAGRTYTATVPAHLLSCNARTLSGTTETTFRVPHRRPGVDFPKERGVLSPAGNLGLDLRVVGLERLTLSASRVHANNLVAHVRGERDTLTSRTLASRELALDVDPTRPEDVVLDLGGLLDDPLGVYRVTVHSERERWCRDSAVVTVTDLGLTAKVTREGVLAWVTSLSQGGPKSGVRVEARSLNNQVLAVQHTDEDGLALLAVPPGHPDGGAWLVSAQAGDDLAFAKLGDRPWVLDGAAGGRGAPVELDGMMYAERGVYRPGETVHLTGLVRTAGGALPGARTLDVRRVRPDGLDEPAGTVTLRVGDQGSFHHRWTAPEDARTGPWRFELLERETGARVAAETVLVETFVAARLELELESPAPLHTSTADLPLRVRSRYLIGPPAAGLGYTVRGSLTPAAPRRAEWTFARVDLQGAWELTPDDGLLDEEGAVEARLALPADLPPGRYLARLECTVTEPGGRSITSAHEVTVDTLPRHLGLSVPAGAHVPPGDVDVAWRFLTPAGEDAPGSPFEVSLHRVEHERRWVWVDGRRRWSSEERLVELERRVLEPTRGLGRLALNCPTSGQYRVTAVDAGTGCVSEVELRVGDDADPAAELQRLELTLDAPRVLPGGEARVTVKGPFPGTLLLALEGTEVLATHVARAEGLSTRVTLPVPADLIGGARLTATLVRALDKDGVDWMPHRAYGGVRVETIHDARLLPVELDVPEEARPGTPVTVHVRTDAGVDPERPARVHLWAVDEGVLALDGYRTPRPHAHFYAARRASVETTDTYKDLLPDHVRPAGTLHVGGDADRARSLRRNPVPARRRESLVLWREAVELDAEGRAQVTFDLPDRTGRLRFFAVAWDHDRYGSADSALTVTSPLDLQVSAPRGVARGDSFRVPVAVFNHTEAPLHVALTAAVDGPLAVDGESTVRVDPHGRATHELFVRARETGAATLTVTAQSVQADRAFVSTSVTHLSVRPITAVAVRRELARVGPGERRTVAPSDDLRSAGRRARVTVGASPVVELAPAIDALVEYPYGCLEQTTSRLFALAAELGLLGDDLVERRSHLNLERIDAGLERLASMQLHDGGLAYWPGGTRSNRWGSAYAASLLVELERRGIEVEASFRARLAEYLERGLRAEEGVSDALQTRALVCRVLGKMRRPQPGWVARLAERGAELDLAATAQVVGALFELGRRDQAAQLLTPELLSSALPASAEGRLARPVRHLATLLDVLLDVEPEHPWIPLLVQRLEDARREGRWGDTLSDASALCALQRFARRGGTKGTVGRVHVPGRAPVPFSGDEPLELLLHEDETLEVEVDGPEPAYLSVIHEGHLVPAALVDADRGLEVRRRYVDALGVPCDLDALEVGRLVHVEVTLRTLGSVDRAPNVAVVDLLPGGLEVENGRLATSSAAAHAMTDARRMEILDDRVLVFATARREPQVFRYALRAVSAGRFSVPPIEASSMYEPDLSSVRKSSAVLVVQP